MTKSTSPLRHIPNIITLFRLILVPPIGYFLWDGNFLSAFLLFVIAGLSDGVDGYLARRFNWASRFGAIADPIADKALLMTTYVLLSYHQHIPIWLTVLVIVRDFTIVAGATAYHNFFGPYKFNATFLGKISTFLQISLAMIMLFSVSIHSIPAIILQILIFLVMLFSLLSGADYVFTWAKKALYAKKMKQQSASHD